MKKVILMSICFLVLLGCQDKGIEKEYEKMSTNTHIISQDAFTDIDLNYYNIEAALDPVTSVITAKQVIDYKNREGELLSELYIHLYPNAFSKESQPSIIGNTDSIDDMHGKIEISSLKINNNPVNFEVGLTDTSIKIPYQFLDGESYKIEIDYLVSVSSTSERFGVVNGIYNLGNWYPILAVYDEAGWHVDPYLSIGDPFYSDVSNYDISMKVPKGYQVAGSGYIYAVDEEDLFTTYHFRADRMRDFAFVISDHFEFIKEKVNDTEVYLYYPKDQADHNWLDDSMSFGADSLRAFEDLIGDYPYKTYSVVLTNFPTGMEYPGLVLISERYLDNTIDALKTVIVHETAHQWFYGIIGNDEINEGWIDEGLTTFFTAYFEIDDSSLLYYQTTMERYRDRVDRMGFDNVVISKSAYDFDEWNSYGAAAYSKPALMYDEIRSLYGDEKILEFARVLYDTYAYKNMKEADLRDVMIEVYGEEIMEILDRWLY